MKSLRSTVMILVLALLPAGAFAANDSHKGDLNLGSSVQVAGKQLPAGDYTVKWDGSGPTAQVNIIRDGKVVATVPARVVKLEKKASDNQTEVSTASNGERTLTAIRFEGKTYALEITPGAGGVDASAGDKSQ